MGYNTIEEMGQGVYGIVFVMTRDRAPLVEYLTPFSPIIYSKVPSSSSAIEAITSIKSLLQERNPLSVSSCLKLLATSKYLIGKYGTTVN